MFRCTILATQELRSVSGQPTILSNSKLSKLETIDRGFGNYRIHPSCVTAGSKSQREWDDEDTARPYRPIYLGGFGSFDRTQGALITTPASLFPRSGLPEE